MRFVFSLLTRVRRVVLKALLDLFVVTFGVEGPELVIDSELHQICAIGSGL